MLNASIYALAGGFEHLFDKLVKDKDRTELQVGEVGIDEDREGVHIKIHERALCLDLYAFVTPREIKVYDDGRRGTGELLFQVGLPVMITETLLPLVVETLYAVAYRERQSRVVEA